MQAEAPSNHPPEPQAVDECPQLEALTDESVMVPALRAQMEAIWPQEVRLLQGYAVPEQARVLDVGCGTGEFVARLATLWPRARITGLDLAPSLLDIARRRTAGIDTISYRQGNGAELPFESASFDAVFCRHVLQAVSRPERILDEMLRVLRPGGVLHLLAEDYGMLYGSRDTPDLDALWHEGWIAAGRTSGIDLRIGRKAPAMLLRRGLLDVRTSFVTIDSQRVDRGLLRVLFSCWKDFANDWVAQGSHLPAPALTALHDALLALLDDPREYVLWMVPIVSAVKPS